MRRIIVILTIATLSISVCANAQTSGRYGFKIAFTSAYQDFQYTFGPTGFEDKYKRLIGFDAGLFMELVNMGNISFVPQLEYKQCGIGMPVGPGVDQNGNLLPTEILYGRVDYFSLPLLVKYRFTDTRISPTVIAGPRIDYLLSYRSDKDFFKDVYDSLKTFNFGGSFGAGIEINKFIIPKMIIEARYNIDITNAYNTEYLKIRNNSFDIWLGFGF